jgi:membrane fusion protein (multidrug efflux system)
LGRFQALPGKRKAQLIGGAVGAVVLAVAVGWWLDAQRWETTENAYVQADTISVSPRLNGTLEAVLVQENQTVQTGDVLARLDPADAEAELAEAKAALAGAKAGLSSVNARRALESAQVGERAAGIAAAQAQAKWAAAEKQRAQRLYEQGLVAPQRLQSAEAQERQALAAVQQARAGFAAQRQAVGAVAATKEEAAAGVAAAQARVRQAELALERTAITAPGPGVVGQLTARVGQSVRAGAPIMAIVPLSDVYITANFKETQLARMRVGQAVEVKADAFPGRSFKGRVESFAPASGSEFAVIPVEHASGNFTKITQRVPVRVKLDPADEAAAGLRPGLSVHIRVDLKSEGGATFAESATAPARVAETDAAKLK